MEVVVGDLMRDFGYTLDQVLNMGYFEANRLWIIADELRARDLQHMSIVLDFHISQEEFRAKFLTWINERQSRRTGYTNGVPKDVIEKFAEAFING